VATRPDFLSEVRAKAQEGIARRLFAEAGESDRQLRELGSAIAEKCGCKAIFGPLKGLERSQGKVQADYGGDWYDLKDVVRMTIVAPNTPNLKAVQTEVRKRCVASEGLGLMKDIELLPAASPCGYSGLNFVVRLKNGRPAEIQANTAQVMYGQMKEDLFRQSIGLNEYSQVKGKYAIDGGLGHIFYELYRVSAASDNGKRAAELSRNYFDYLRGFPNYQVAQEMQKQIGAFKAANMHAFQH